MVHAQVYQFAHLHEGYGHGDDRHGEYLDELVSGLGDVVHYHHRHAFGSECCHILFIRDW